MMISHRADDVQYVNPVKEVNAGLWTLLVSASVFLSLRLWCKYAKRNGLWYDDYVLVISWVSNSAGGKMLIALLKQNQLTIT